VTDFRPIVSTRVFYIIYVFMIFHVTSSHAGPDFSQPTAGRTARNSRALQAGGTLNHRKCCHRQVVKDQHAYLDSDFGPIRILRT